MLVLLDGARVSFVLLGRGLRIPKFGRLSDGVFRSIRAVGQFGDGSAVMEGCRDLVCAWVG